MSYVSVMVIKGKQKIDDDYLKCYIRINLLKVIPRNEPNRPFMSSAKPSPN